MHLFGSRKTLEFGVLRTWEVVVNSVEMSAWKSGAFEHLWPKLVVAEKVAEKCQLCHHLTSEIKAVNFSVLFGKVMAW